MRIVINLFDLVLEQFPAFGSIGATGNYAGVTGMGQLTLALAMLLGRLELFTVLALLRGEYWLSSKRW